MGEAGGNATKQKYGDEFFHQLSRRGGQVVSQNRAHMAALGRKSGAVRRERRQPPPLCTICGERPQRYRGRCARCYGYRRTNGRERPVTTKHRGIRWRSPAST
jgi:hypothetical protein